MNLWYLLAVSVGINLVGFVVAYKLRSDKLTDFSYGATFFVLAFVAYLAANKQNQSTKVLGLSMVTLWAVRLAGFLLYRILMTNKDKRFDGVRENFWKFGRFWLFQGITAWIILLPTLFFMNDPAAAVKPLAWVGFAVWFVGLEIETIADAQKFQFNNKSVNKGKWIESGLWHYSRHPNYFGEILNWAGIYIFMFSFLSTTQRLIGLISPVFIASLLLFVTGVPKLEKYADQKWGNQGAYRDYKKRTSLIFPLPNKQ